MSLFLGQDFEAKSKCSEETLRHVEEQAADSASKVRLTNCFLCFCFVCLLSTMMSRAVVLKVLDSKAPIVQHDIHRDFL